MKFVYKRSSRTRGLALSALLLGTSGALAGELVRINGRDANRHAADDATYAVTSQEGREFRFEVRPGDQWAGDRTSNTNERAELSLDKSPVRMGVRYRVSYDMLVEQGPPVTSAWLVAGQWHATEDKGDAPSSPPLAFELAGSDLVVYTQATTEARHTKNPAGIERARVPGIERDRWYHVDYDVRFDPREGELNVRLDGRTILSGAIPVGYADAVGPYFKFGIYRSKGPEAVAIRYRNLTIREQLLP